LEDDALVLLNMKKDITNSQKEELLKLKMSVLSIKKEHDTIYVANNAKETQLKSIQDRYTALANVEQSTVSSGADVEELTRSLREQADVVLEEYEAEQRTIKMITLMLRRLDKEISQCRVDTAKMTILVEHAKHDVSLTEVSVQASRQEVLDQEAQLDKLNATLKARKDQRDQKINMLHSLSHEGESSVARLQNSISEHTRRLESSDRQRMRQQQSSRMNATRVGKEEEDEFADLTLPSAKRKLSIVQVREMVQRYQSQTARMDRLKQLDTELRSTIVQQQKKKNEFSEHLAHTVSRIQQLASSRQIYQEVDLKDSALAATSKECEDCKERDYRMKLSLEALKQSIPRFLMKVTKVSHPKPTENQLADAVLKLEDELAKLIKTIGSALLKDATPEDLALMSQQSAAANNDANSEFGRLQRLPGYSRLQRQLFYNLMTAQPDVSQHNIRIDHIGRVKAPKTTNGPASHFEDPAASTVRKLGKTTTGVHSERVFARTDALGNEVFDMEEPALGRATIKNISKLICERGEVAKPMPVNND